MVLLEVRIDEEEFHLNIYIDLLRETLGLEEVYFSCKKFFKSLRWNISVGWKYCLRRKYSEKKKFGEKFGRVQKIRVV